MLLYVNGLDEQTLNLWILVRVQVGALTNYCGIAQLVEQRNHNPCVEGSSPSAATMGTW